MSDDNKEPGPSEAEVADMVTRALDPGAPRVRLGRGEIGPWIESLPRDDTRPSIAELQRRAPALLEMRDTIARKEAEPLIHRATPVLLEIVAAAMAWRDQRAENLRAALLRTEAEIEAEAQDVQRARVKRTADLARALEVALSKVRP